MPEVEVSVTKYCPRCDRGYTGVAKADANFVAEIIATARALKIMEDHFVKHNEDMPSAETEG